MLARRYNETMIVEFPLISKRDILDTYRPGREPVETLFRSLRDNKLVSDGLPVVLRGEHGRLGGTLRLYCALNRDSARLARRGRSEDARQLAIVAKEIEDSPPTTRVLSGLIDIIGGQGATSTDKALAVAFTSLAGDRPDLRTDMFALGEQIERGRAAFEPKHRDRFFGVVTSLDSDGTAEISEEQGTRRVLFPIAGLAERGLDHEGQAVAIFWESFGDGRLLSEAEPAIRLEIPERPLLDSRLELEPDILATLRADKPTVEIRQPIIRD